MLGQPLLQPDCGKGKGGIHRCLQEEDQPFWGTLMTSLPSSDLPCFFLAARLDYSTLIPLRTVLGALGPVKFHMSVSEGLICCQLLQRAPPGSSWQERLPGTAALQSGLPSETMGVLPSSQLLPLCQEDAFQPDSPSHLPQALGPADQGNATHLLCNSDVVKAKPS